MSKQLLDELLDNYKLNKNINFDFDKGYHVWYQDNKIIIKLLFKNMDNWCEHLSKILQKKIEIVPDNLSENKDYATLFKNFKSQYKVINLQSFKIYNSDIDKINYNEKWKNKIND